MQRKECVVIRKKRIVIDPGHGGYQPGAVGNGLVEKYLTLSISHSIKSQLLKYDCEVKMTRETDLDISLLDRAIMANTWGADVFVSVHINAGGGTGYEDFVWDGGVRKNTLEFQKVFHDGSMTVLSNFRDRGVKKYNFSVLRNTEMPAILAENLFIDSKIDSDWLKSPQNLHKLGVAQADAIARYLSLELKQNVNTTQTVAKKPDISKSLFKRTGSHNYYEIDGIRQTGWHKLGDYWYHFEDTGVQDFGFKYIDGQWFYFRTFTGTMAVGWQCINGQNYYFRQEGDNGKLGSRVSGWQWIKNAKGTVEGWHYFGKDGQLIGLGEVVTEYNPW